MDIFTTRELAAGFWLAALIAWGLSRAKIRAAFGRVVYAAFVTKLAFIWMLGAAWMTLGIYLLSRIHLWERGDLKDTIFWCLSAGVVVLVHGFSQREQRPNYPRIIRDLFEVTILLEILLSTYCFSLPAELLLFILVAFTTAIQVYSSIKTEYRYVHILATCALIFFSGIMIWGAVGGFFRDPRRVWNLVALNSIARPVLLTLWLLPASYGLGVIAAYEVLFIPFKLGKKRALRFAILARIRLIRHFGIRLNTILNAPRQLRGRLYGLSSMSEIDDLLVSYREKETISRGYP